MINFLTVIKLDDSIEIAVQKEATNNCFWQNQKLKQLNLIATI